MESLITWGAGLVSVICLTLALRKPAADSVAPVAKDAPVTPAAVPAPPVAEPVVYKETEFGTYGKPSPFVCFNPEYTLPPIDLV